MKEIVLAGGCFWGVEAYFQQKVGIVDTEVGYANGYKDNPTYEEVCQHITGHAEVVKLTYDPDVISLETILLSFWRIIDNTVEDRQGPDIGNQYRTGIYYFDDSDLDVLRKSFSEVQRKQCAAIKTEVLPLGKYFPAEEYHQDYLKKNPHGYCHIDLSL